MPVPSGVHSEQQDTSNFPDVASPLEWEQNQWEELEWPSTEGTSEFLYIFWLGCPREQFGCCLVTWHKFFYSVTEPAREKEKLGEGSQNPILQKFLHETGLKHTYHDICPKYLMNIWGCISSGGEEKAIGSQHRALLPCEMWQHREGHGLNFCHKLPVTSANTCIFGPLWFRSFYQPPLGLGIAPIALQHEHLPDQSTPAMGEFAEELSFVISTKKSIDNCSQIFMRRKQWHFLMSWKWKEEILISDTDWSFQSNDATEDTKASLCLAKRALPALAAEHDRSCWVKRERLQPGLCRGVCCYTHYWGLVERLGEEKEKSPHGRWSIFNEPKPLPQIKWNILKRNNITLVLFVSAT